MPQPGSQMVASTELLMIHLSSGAKVNPAAAVRIFRSDGSLFDSLALDSPALVDASPTRIILRPGKPLVLDESYFVTFTDSALDTGLAVSDRSWNFRCGQVLNELKLTWPETNQEFRLLVSLPPSYGSAPTRRYRVVYITDADYFNNNQFSEIADAARRQEIEELILVGIAYPSGTSIREVRDFRGRDMGQNPDRFLGFLANTVVPQVDRLYRTQVGQNTLIGNSIGGYFTACALLAYRPGSSFQFQNFFAVAQLDPLTAREAAQAAAIADLPFRVFLAVGGADGASRLSAYQRLLDSLAGRNYRSLQLFGRVYEGLPHGEQSAIPAFRDAFRRFFGQ